MANWNGLQLTNKGIALQAKVQAGTELEITKLKLGSGVVPSGTDIKTLTDLITPEQNLGIGGTEAVGDYCKVSATISNSGLEAGYYVRELGVFAQDPDEGEILYLYATDGAPDYLPAGGGSTVISQEFNVMIAVNDTDNVSVEIASDTLATMGYVLLQIQQHDNNAGAHEAAFNAHNAGVEAHTDKIASQAEAEAQSNQNNKKFMTPLRVYQAIVAYFTQFLAAAVFTGIVKAVAPGASSNDTSVPTTSWVRTCIANVVGRVVKSVNGVMANENGNVNVDTFAETDITANADLNNFMDDGFYVALTSDIFNTTQNKPENGAFYLQVVRGKLTTQRYQILFNISTNTIWTRTNITGSNWGVWVKLAKETEVALPVGTILPFAGGSIPSGFLACNGAGVSATTYADLYAVIGNTYGGNSTTFNLPQIEDNRFLEFSSTIGTQKNAGLPNITGTFDVRRGYNQYGEDDGTLEGAFIFNNSNNAFTSATRQTNSAQNTNYGIQTVGTTRVTFNAANANSIYGGSTTVQPKSLTVRAIIKY